MTEIKLLVPVQGVKLSLEKFDDSPNLNLGYIKHGKMIILIKMIYTKPKDLIKFGFEFDQPDRVSFAKTHTIYSLQITNVEEREIGVYYPFDYYPSDDDRVLFLQRYDKLENNVYNNINTYLSKFEPEPININQIKETLVKIKKMTD
jgi:hypothetical protein